MICWTIFEDRWDHVFINLLEYFLFFQLHIHCYLKYYL